MKLICNQNLESVFIVRVYSESGTLMPGLMAFRTRAGAEECVRDWAPKGFRAEILEVELGD